MMNDDIIKLAKQIFTTTGVIEDKLKDVFAKVGEMSDEDIAHTQAIAQLVTWKYSYDKNGMDGLNNACWPTLNNYLMRTST